MSTQTEAWVLPRRKPNEEGPGRLRRETLTLPDLPPDRVLVEPVYGCWEGNMTHALERLPVDVCQMRGEDSIVLGNAATVRVLRTGRRATRFREGDVCMLSAIGKEDAHGFMSHAFAYDTPGTVGVLAKQLHLAESSLFALPKNSRFSPRQWAAFSLRYNTAWANWNVALGAFRLQTPTKLCECPVVVGWGGGVALGQLMLAKLQGCRAIMIASSPERLELIRSLGIQAVDRRAFSALHFDPTRYKRDEDYRKAYREAEACFLDTLRTATDGDPVNIFFDHIGAPVQRATLKALGRQGVMATVGWKGGMKTPISRAQECIAHHIHVHTHGARYDEAVEAIRYAEHTGWMAPLDTPAVTWDQIPELANAVMTGKNTSYFPTFQCAEEA